MQIATGKVVHRRLRLGPVLGLMAGVIFVFAQSETRAQGRGRAGVAVVQSASPAQADTPGELVFEVASIKHLPARPAPGTAQFPYSPTIFHKAWTVNELVQFAYNVRDYALFGGPDWVRDEWFEINAKAPGPATNNQFRSLVKSLLRDEFNLVVTRTTRDMTRYTLRLANSDGRPGSGMKACADPQNEPQPKWPPLPREAMPFAGWCYSSAMIATQAESVLGAAVVDNTGLPGLWNYLAAYSPVRPGGTSADSSNVPAFDTALREELGLRLDRDRGPVEVLVIESVQIPIAK